LRERENFKQKSHKANVVLWMSFFKLAVPCSAALLQTSGYYFEDTTQQQPM